VVYGKIRMHLYHETKNYAHIYLCIEQAVDPFDIQQLGRRGHLVFNGNLKLPV
jgi:hypothetical protein